MPIPLQTRPRRSARDGGRVYAVDEGAGQLVAFEALPDGGLREIDRASSQGASPTHLALDRTGAWLVAANYGSGTVVAVAVGLDGDFGEARPPVYVGPNAHQVVFDAANRFAYVPALGDDAVVTLAFDPATGALAEQNRLALASGAGPRHLVLHPESAWAYVVNELDDTVVAADVDPDTGALTAFQTVSTLPPGVDGAGNTCAEVALDPAGRFLYASNRGHDSVARFALDPDGSLAPLEHTETGATPRHFSLAGDRMFVGNMGQGSVSVFAVDPQRRWPGAAVVAPGVAARVRRRARPRLNRCSLRGPAACAPPRRVAVTGRQLR